MGFSADVFWQHRLVFLNGAATTFLLAALAFVGATILGVILALASMPERSRVVRGLASGVVDLLRATPLLVLVFMVYLVLPEFGLPALPAIATFVAVLALVHGAYYGEDLRAALDSLPSGYRDGAFALGLRRWQTLLHVELPLALRQALPALTATSVGLVKDTSIASVIALPEITYVARALAANEFRFLEGWLTAAALYLISTALITRLGLALERALPGRA